MQPLILASTIAIGMMLGYKLNDKPEIDLISAHSYPNDSIYQTGRVEELIRFIDNRYVDKINADELTNAAVEAIFSKLDPHSVYMTPQEVEDNNVSMNGKYYGIGIENYFIDDTINVSNVFNQSPAAKAGLKMFDKIVSIDGIGVAGQKMDYDQIRKMMHKELGQSLELGVMREGQPLKFKLNIEEIPLKSVKYDYLPDIQTEVIKIDRFAAHTYSEFMAAIETHFKDNKAKHLIIDLRNNPGGYLPEVVNILCQIFEEKERLLFYTEGRNNKKNEYKTTGKRFFNINKVVVLIDENSASASEILAGAIQDWDRGLIIGRRSFGKGLVQEQYALNNGGAIRLTVSRYYTPSGRSIQRNYTNASQYGNDLTARYVHGDLFYKDSTLVKDTEVFQTKILNRKVMGSGGITPDIFIGLPEQDRDPAYYEIKSLIPEFAFTYLSHHTELVKEAGRPQVDDKVEKAFKKFISEKSELFDSVKEHFHFEPFREEIAHEMWEVTLKAYNNDVVVRFYDKFMNAAISVIRTDKGPADYTTEK